MLRQGEPHEMDDEFDPTCTLSKEKRVASATLFFFGGDGEDRTLDLLNAIQALSQLSYAPVRLLEAAHLLYAKCGQNASTFF